MTQLFILLLLCIMSIVAFEVSLWGEARNRTCAVLKGIFSASLYFIEFFVVMFSIYYVATYAYNGTVDARTIAFFVGFAFIPLYVNYGRMILGDHTNIDTSDWFWWILMGMLSFSIILMWNIYIFNY